MARKPFAYYKTLKEALLEKESAKRVPGLEKVWATNLGRIVVQNGRGFYVTIGHKNKAMTNYYYRIKIRGVDYTVSRLVYTAWKDKTSPLNGKKGSNVDIIDHISGDTLDNRPENLQRVSQSINIKKAHTMNGYTRNKPSKQCLAYNIKSGCTKYFACTGDLVYDLFPDKKHNNGRFNYSYKHQTIIGKEWVVGYTEEDIDATLKKHGLKNRKV